MSKKLLLVHPINNKVRRFWSGPMSVFAFPPLGLTYVAAVTPDDWEIELWDENFKPCDYPEADLVGLTALTASVTRAYEIAAVYRERGVPTVLGGWHASTRHEEALDYVDAVVVGEAETAWPQLIADLESGGMQKIYRGERTDLGGLARPRRDLLNPRYVLGTIQTSRGCPLDCEFCVATTIFGHRFRLRPVEEVLDELEAIPQKYLWFVDDNFIFHSKRSQEWAMELFEGIVKRGIKKRWACETMINIAENEEVLEAAHRAGCRAVFLGMESCEEDALAELGKQVNLEVGVNAYDEVLKRIHEHGLIVVGSFMLGLDRDTRERLFHRAQFITSGDVDVAQATVLTPMPGTRMMDRIEEDGRLLYTEFPSDWGHYDGTEPTFEPLIIGVEELRDSIREICSRLHSLRTIFRKSIGIAVSTRSITNTIWTLLANLGYRHIMKVVLKDYPRSGR